MIKSTINCFVLTTIITGVIYTLIVTGFSQLLMPYQANGSIISLEDKAVGSALVGQNFTTDKYFHGRPSATSPEPYAADASSGSNLAVISKTYSDLMTERVKLTKIENPKARIPMDLLTASGSGLDPEITFDAALFQAPRVAYERKIPLNEIIDLINQNRKLPWLGIFGYDRVNVLKINIALDEKSR